MIEIKKQSKEKSYFLKINDATFSINPDRPTENNYIILTNNDFTINRNTIFQAPGEYEVKHVYFYGLPGGTFLFVDNFYSLLFSEKEPNQNVINQIKNKTHFLPIIFILNLTNVNFWQQEFQAQVFITKKNVKIDNLKVQKVNTVRINPRRIEPSIYLLQ